MNHAQQTPTRPVNLAAPILTTYFSLARRRLPPWVLEFIPDALKGVAKGLGNDVGEIDRAVVWAIESCVVGKGGTRTFLSGKYIGKAKDAHKQNLRDCFMKCVATGVWKDTKNGLKLACGGKKKRAGFKLKPSLRKFENTRV